MPSSLLFAAPRVFSDPNHERKSLKPSLFQAEQQKSNQPNIIATSFTSPGFVFSHADVLPGSRPAAAVAASLLLSLAQRRSNIAADLWRQSRGVVETCFNGGEGVSAFFGKAQSIQTELTARLLIDRAHQRHCTRR